MCSFAKRHEIIKHKLPDYIWSSYQKSFACLNPFSTISTQYSYILFSSVQLLSRVWLFATLWTLAHQTSLSITNSGTPPKPMSIESVIPSNHLMLCHPLLLLPSIFPSTRVLSNESVLHIRWPKYWSFSFNISPSNEHPGLISFRMDWLAILAVQGTLKSLLQHHPYGRKWRRTKKPLDESERGEWKSWLKTQHSEK